MVPRTIRLIASFHKPFRTYRMRLFVDTADSVDIKSPAAAGAPIGVMIG
jgi:hypothetical protein